MKHTKNNKQRKYFFFHVSEGFESEEVVLAQAWDLYYKKNQDDIIWNEFITIFIKGLLKIKNNKNFKKLEND